ncbi:hypothetical protein BGX23_007083 [Mortierella sp. AD031]|nr:hypothetical protein BGX23_007083 [Mortierella sp. AD031]
MDPDQALQIPEIIDLVGKYLPLFERRFESGRYRFVDVWNPKNFLNARLVCKAWNNVFTRALWHTYDHAIMEKKVPLEIVKLNMPLVRQLSILDKKHKKNAALWEALMLHDHINRLEVHDAVFPIRRLMGARPPEHSLSELKLSGTCTRMHPFLLIFVQRSEHLRVLELTRFKFTPTDWNRIIKNKSNLRKLVILQQCVFLKPKTDDEEDEEDDKKKVVKIIEDTMDMDVDKKAVVPTNAVVANTTNNNSTPTTTNATTNNGDEAGAQSRRIRRAQLMDVELPDAEDIGILNVRHLVLADNRLLLPFQRSILQACPHLVQLEICYSQRSDGGAVATLVRENCEVLRRLTLRSTRQPWTLAMIEGAPETVEELILYTGQLDLQMAAAIKDRKDTLTRLDLDFGQGSKGKRRLACILSILRECEKLREFSYHNHAEDKVFKEIMFKKPWNLPNLVKLRLHGVSPRAKYGGIPQVPVPEGWRQEYGGRKASCCSARSYEDVRKLGSEFKSPLFDVALLQHIGGLETLSEVVVSEAVYRRLL